MSKILKNSTASVVSVSDTGVAIPASGQYTIPANDYPLWASSDNVVTLVGAGTLVVNDGSSDLSISDGIDRIKGHQARYLYGADGTPIGNVGDRTKVDAALSSNFPGFSAANALSLSFGAAVTSPAWPAVKPLSYYVVPAGKTFRMLGMAYKTSAPTTYVTVFQRKMLWKFAIATANPTAPTLSAKTIVDSGLTLLAAYRYKIVGVNHVGSTAGSAEATVTLTGTQNAVSLSWAAIAGCAYYEIHRTSANGTINTQKLVGLSDVTTLTDVVPDSELDATVTPSTSNTTGGNIDGLAYSGSRASTMTVIDTLAAITTPTPLDVIYRNIYGERKHITVTPGAAIGTQVELTIAGKTNASSNSRISRGGGRHFVDVAVGDVLSVSNLPATGGFVVYGITPLLVNSVAQGSRWENFMLENALTFAAGEEIVFGISGNLAVTTASRQDVILIGVLE